MSAAHCLRWTRLACCLSVLVIASAGTTASDRILFQDGQMSIEQLGDCADPVTWQVTAKSAEYFTTYLPLMQANLLGPQANLVAVCPNLESIVVLGTVGEERLYAGRMDKAGGWRLKPVDLSTVADVEIRGDRSAEKLASLLPLHEIDLMAPYGIKRGMPIAEVDKNLTAMGLLREHTCHWRSTVEAVHLRLSVSVDSPPGTNPQMACTDDRIVNFASFEQRETRSGALAELPTPTQMVQSWIDRFGEPLRDCSQILHTGPATQARCIFREVDDVIGQMVLMYFYNEGIEGTARLATSLSHSRDVPKQEPPKPGSLTDQIRQIESPKAPD